MFEMAANSKQQISVGISLARVGATNGMMFTYHETVSTNLPTAPPPPAPPPPPPPPTLLHPTSPPSPPFLLAVVRRFIGLLGRLESGQGDIEASEILQVSPLPYC